ncbi:MAG: thermonuclease family protein, partial [Chloroflexi bacterium]|nr:thermonuclease family protein [Chloroflexota bacterium]
MPIAVTRVSDGDTVVVREDRRFAQEFRVRLYGIDAPESDQPLGRESTRALQQMVRWQPLSLDVFAHDRYGRAIGLLYPRGGDQRESLNVAMVREGWAYCYHRNGRYSQGLNAAQRQAQAARRGVWAQPANAERPWTYRRRASE